MKDFLNFVLQFQQNLFTVPAIVFFMCIAVVMQNNKGAQDRLVAGLIGALAPVAYYERKNISATTTRALEGLAGALNTQEKELVAEGEAERKAENEEDNPNKA
jgi:hypothetical protein